MKRLMLILISISITFLISCTHKQSTQSTETETPTSVIPEKKPNNLIGKNNLNQYFLEDNSTARYTGIGNEYATFTLRTHYLNDNYIATYEDNGGTIMRRYYRISPNQITLIEEQGEAYKVSNPSQEELDEMEDISVYLKKPLHVGTEFDGWEIISDTAIVKSALQRFEDVVIIEKTDEQGNLMRKYFAEGFGEVQREYISNTGEDPFTVISTIEQVK